MSDSNNFVWEKPEKIKLGFVKKLRLAVNTYKDDMELEDILKTPPQKELDDFISYCNKNKNNDIEIIE
tara:strand:+ start:656 stop:859 length:204 start_codon:yes stop_codon:yes gene_type:complete